MDFLQIAPSDTLRWNKVWDLYQNSFPVAEQRKAEDHLRALADTAFHPVSAWEGKELIGLLFYWEWDSYRYLEHLAVSAPVRGQGYGSEILRFLKDTSHSIILEIDPLVNELSVRRLQFYERAGFALTPFRFVHLPYRLDFQPIELLILSFPKMISPSQHKDFLAFLEKRVILYCEQPAQKRK
ncbi:MAG: GNAT family N-acetyltransferase [Dysgonamonadaceae bacterium]|jgi:GNAT superfamily N-acetyltransferase|nr:GNAT family N-acetyltransferase [Dysgonamonadaceae bacterium]